MYQLRALAFTIYIARKVQSVLDFDAEGCTNVDNNSKLAILSSTSTLPLDVVSHVLVNGANSCGLFRTPHSRDTVQAQVCVQYNLGILSADYKFLVAKTMVETSVVYNFSQFIYVML